MGTTAQKLAKLQETKADIKQSIIEKGVSVPSDATFASYPGYIDQITTGGGVNPVGNIELQQQSGTDVSNYATASAKQGSATTPATTQQHSQPTISALANIITATVPQQTISITPTVSEGWVSEGTAGTVTLSQNSNTYTMTIGGVKVDDTTYTQSTPTFSKNGNVITASVAAQSNDLRPNVTTAGYIAQINASKGTISLGGSSASYTIPTQQKNAVVNGTVSADSGKYLTQVNVNLDVVNYHVGHGTPSNSLGSDGDIYIDLG